MTCTILIGGYSITVFYHLALNFLDVFSCILNRKRIMTSYGAPISNVYTGAINRRSNGRVIMSNKGEWQA